MDNNHGTVCTALNCEDLGFCRFLGDLMSAYAHAFKHAVALGSGFNLNLPLAVLVRYLCALGAASVLTSFKVYIVGEVELEVMRVLVNFTVLFVTY